MKFDKRKDISPKYLLLTCTIICIGLLFASYFAMDKVAAVKNVAIKVITPIQNGINQIGLWTDSKLENLKKIEALTAENDSLKQEIAEYKDDITALQNRQNELIELQSLYQLDEQYPDYNKTAANVFAKDASSWFSTFYIDKGTNNGLFEGANVMCDSGLAGIITECHKDYSKVRAIIDDSSNVSVDFHYCALVSAWKKLGFDDATCDKLCDMAMDGDRGIAEAMGLKLDLTDTIAKGCSSCKLHFHK